MFEALGAKVCAACARFVDIDVRHFVVFRGWALGFRISMAWMGGLFCVGRSRFLAHINWLTNFEVQTQFFVGVLALQDPITVKGRRRLASALM